MRNPTFMGRLRRLYSLINTKQWIVFGRLNLCWKGVHFCLWPAFSFLNQSLSFVELVGLLFSSK